MVSGYVWSSFVLVFLHGQGHHHSQKSHIDNYDVLFLMCTCCNTFWLMLKCGCIGWGALLQTWDNTFPFVSWWVNLSLLGVHIAYFNLTLLKHIIYFLFHSCFVAINHPHCTKNCTFYFTTQQHYLYCISPHIVLPLLNHHAWIKLIFCNPTILAFCILFHLTYR